MPSGESPPPTPPRFRLTSLDPPPQSSNVTPGSLSVDEPVSDLAFLSQALINERCTPELLPFAELPMNNLMELVEYQEVEISEVPSTTDHSFIQMLKTMELERVKFVMRTYLRTRLQKLERFALYLASNPNECNRVLSQPEQLYLQHYHHLLCTHLNDSALKHLPEMWQSLDEQSENVDMVPKPPLDSAVFIRVVKDIGDIQLPEDREPITMLKDELYLVRYIGIRELLLQGKVEIL